MYTDIILTYIIAVVSLVFAVLNSIMYILKRNKTAKINGVIISTFSPNTNLPKKNNCKLATVSYNINNKEYLSQNPIQVPLYVEKGNMIKLFYDINNPQKIYNFSIKKIIIFLLISVICAALAAIKQ